MQNKLSDLKKRLDELKILFQGHGGSLKVEWTPGKKHIEKIGGARYYLNGEVVDDVIKIYVEDFDEAINVLLHEFIEHIIKKEFSEPYILLTQMVSQAYDDISYFRQEKVIDALTILLKKMPRTKKLEKIGIIRRVDDEN